MLLDRYVTVSPVPRFSKILWVALVATVLALMQLLAVSPSASADEPGPSIEIETITPEILTDEEEVTVTVRVSNFDSDSATRVVVFMQADPFQSIDAVRKFLDGRGAYGWAAGEAQLDESQLKRAATKDGARVQISMKKDELPLWNETAWGPYGIEARAISSGHTAPHPDDQSILMWYPPGTEGSIALNLLLPASTEPGAVATLLEKTRDGVTLALTPPQAQALATDSRGDGIESVVLPAQRADLSMLASVNQMALYKIASDSRYLEPVEVDEDDPEGSSPRPNTRGGDGSLLVEDVVVVSDGWMSNQVLEAAGTNAVLSPPDGLSPTSTLDFTPSSKTVVARSADSAPEGVLPGEDLVTVIDSWNTLGEIFSASPEDLSPLDLRQEIRSLTALVAKEETQETPYLWVNIPATADAASLEEKLSAALDTPWVQPVSLQEILEGPTSTVPRVPTENATHGDFQVTSDLMKQLNTAFDLAQSVASAASDPSGILSEQTDTILYPTAAGISLDERTVRVKDAVASLEDTFDIIEVAPTRTVNVLNSDADFPVTLTNRGTFPVNVQVGLQISDVRLQSNKWVEVTVPTKGSVIAQIPVAAVGSGDVSARVVARTPDGTVLDASQEIDVRVRAGLEDTLTWVVAGIVGALFVIGLVRTLRKGRRSPDQQRVRGRSREPAGKSVAI